MTLALRIKHAGASRPVVANLVRPDPLSEPSPSAKFGAQGTLEGGLGLVVRMNVWSKQRLGELLKGSMNVHVAVGNLV